ncbi:TetR/AcrR family transcriptional regulator [Solirhodobacter olei]|uniref:TetR/AcrR family transcriptional regulator n=1 Tax=Solirhodobacter olei TaxID=2493082 RepID=UPI000FDA989E|nr:TetR family transcriptional regulator [Solirhodobacter olei]
MSRKAGTSPKERLLSAALEHIRANEAPDFSLRELAAAIGTSHRMLVYHFGSREGLLIEIVRSFEVEQAAWMRGLLDDDARPLVARLREVWRSFCAPGMRPREKLFFEVYGYALAGRDDTRDFLHALVDTWLAPLEIVAEKIGVAPDARRASAGLLLAVTRGLLLSLLASGNLRQVEETMEHFLANYVPLRDHAERSTQKNPSSNVTLAGP